MRILRYCSAVLVAMAIALVVPTAASAAPSWYSGTVAPGATQAWTWGNANPLSLSYEVGFSPFGVTTSASCEFELIRSWYVMQPATQERQFKFIIKNVGTISCGTMILIKEMPTVAGPWSTPPLKPGETSTHTWNNAAPFAAYWPGLTPSIVSPSIPCQLEVTRRWDLKHTNEAGAIEREFHFDVKNVGLVTCSGAILLGSVQDLGPDYLGLFELGEVKTYHWNNANPLDKVYIIGVSPGSVSATGTCAFEVIRRWYVQKANGNTPEREFWYTLKNVGNMVCGPNVLLN